MALPLVEFFYGAANALTSGAQDASGRRALRTEPSQTRPPLSTRDRTLTENAAHYSSPPDPRRNRTERRSPLPKIVHPATGIEQNPLARRITCSPKLGVSHPHRGPIKKLFATSNKTQYKVEHQNKSTVISEQKRLQQQNKATVI